MRFLAGLILLTVACGTGKHGVNNTSQSTEDALPKPFSDQAALVINRLTDKDFSFTEQSGSSITPKKKT